ncbi:MULTISPECIES: flagella synthesis protein FlgN [unclassified Vibrio]|uniref:Flagellar export chaperone FlgN n=1 Tax=Vibrio sp. HB236076 TaxID=3232307 RepID=A0AB39HCU5_9VIBR|nr:flagellar export chaperone FlgN [Vibrio sp. HB161653]MDP5254259.1 flagellar export chaperone FlgN [Vibrio sp. HB161653]
MVALVDLVQFQLDSANELEQVLSDETQAITQRISSQIESVALKKNELVERLKITDQRIAAHPDVTKLSDDDNLSAKVSDIQAIITRCQEINLVNGEALARAEMSFRKLNNLLQETNRKAGMTYNAGGKTQSISTLGTNIKA